MTGDPSNSEISSLYMSLHKGYYFLYDCLLRDTRTGKMNQHITGKAQNATCIYCKKTIVAWGKKAKASSYTKVPDKLIEAFSNHIIPCSEKWMWRILSKVSSGLATDEEMAIVSDWNKRYSNQYGHTGKVTRGPYDRVKYKLPYPLGSEEAIIMETLLITISSLWDKNV